MQGVRGLDAEALCKRRDPDQFGVESTEELENLQEMIGQPRAVEAVRFGVEVARREGAGLLVVPIRASWGDEETLAALVRIECPVPFVAYGRWMPTKGAYQ